MKKFEIKKRIECERVSINKMLAKLKEDTSFTADIAKEAASISASIKDLSIALCTEELLEGTILLNNYLQRVHKVQEEMLLA